MSAQSLAKYGKDERKSRRVRASLRRRRSCSTGPCEFGTIGVDAIAEAAGTNKMTLYRHFPFPRTNWSPNICANPPK